MFALGIDVGSTNIKAALVGDDGSLGGVTARALTTTTQGDAVTQDADQIWAAVCDAVAELTAAHPAAAAEVVAIGVCSQYSSIVPVDAQARAVGPLKMYLDSRGADHCWAILGEPNVYPPSYYISAVIVALVIATGVSYFRKTERTFADVI